MKIKSSDAVQEKFDQYPSHVRPKMQTLRKLILDIAANSADVEQIEETLKWGEPSYLVKGGSTIRMDWKERAPDQYALYFNCNTSLVETFRAIYRDNFQYEKNRAIVFHLEDALPAIPLSDCILMALTYHQHKHKPFLGRI